LKRLGNVVATADEADDVSSAVKAEGAHFGDFPITFNVLRDENFGIYASAVEALANLHERLGPPASSSRGSRLLRGPPWL
jgi:hypothetical protein